MTSYQCKTCGDKLYVGIGHGEDYCATMVRERKIQTLELQSEALRKAMTRISLEGQDGGGVWAASVASDVLSAIDKRNDEADHGCSACNGNSKHHRVGCANRPMEQREGPGSVDE